MPVVDPGPFLLDNPGSAARTGLVVATDPDTMPAVAWAGPVPKAGLDPAMVAALADGSWRCALLPEHATGWFGRPGLSEYDISYVTWDHNRSLVDAGSARRAGAPAVHAQTLAVYALLDELRRRHPDVEWESCASGGGRVDLGILERAERIWVSDMTDALARQSIQRWTGQLVPPEYCGAHVSAPTAHQTGRHLPLALRAATALFGHFGIEWDLTTADRAALDELASWVRLYKAHRALIHSGRVTRADAPDGTALMHGVAAADRGAALMSYVQLDEPTRTQAVALRWPGLDPSRLYRVTDVTPENSMPVRATAPVIPRGPVSGALLAEIGVAVPVQRPHTPVILFAEAT
jgi:alpha-galactosidase